MAPSDAPTLHEAEALISKEFERVRSNLIAQIEDTAERLQRAAAKLRKGEPIGELAVYGADSCGLLQSRTSLIETMVGELNGLNAAYKWVAAVEKKGAPS